MYAGISIRKHLHMTVYLEFSLSGLEISPRPADDLKSIGYLYLNSKERGKHESTQHECVLELVPLWDRVFKDMCLHFSNKVFNLCII